MDTGGTSEIIEDGRSGLLAYDVDQLGDAVSRIVHDEPVRSRLKEGAISRARAYSPEVLVPLYEAVYRVRTGEGRSSPEALILSPRVAWARGVLAGQAPARPGVDVLSSPGREEQAFPGRVVGGTSASCRVAWPGAGPHFQLPALASSWAAGRGRVGRGDRHRGRPGSHRARLRPQRLKDPAGPLILNPQGMESITSAVSRPGPAPPEAALDQAAQLADCVIARRGDG
jgi:hypothetical protein